MASEPRCVLFVRQGSWGDVSEQEENENLDLLLGHVNRLRKRTDAGEEVPAVAIEVVETTDQAEERLRSWPHPDMVVFRSRGMEGYAKQLKQRHRGVRVIVLSGLIPDEEIVWVSKGWLYGEMLKEIFTRAW